MNSLTRKIIVATIVGLFFGGSAAVGGAIQFPDLPAVAYVGWLLSGFALGAMLGFAVDWMVTNESFRNGLSAFWQFLWAIFAVCGGIYGIIVLIMIITNTPDVIGCYCKGIPDSLTGEVPSLGKVVFCSFISILCFCGLIFAVVSIAKSVWFLKIRAKLGFASSQYKLATHGWDIDGEMHSEKDMYESVKWYRKAAEKGHALAQFDLGGCYHTGWGVAQDSEEAVKWYRKAAEKGHALAQFNLGNFYHSGDGVAQDSEEAVKWYRKAAEQGNISAQGYLGGC